MASSIQLLFAVLMLSVTSVASADELTKMIQQDLQGLGYDVGVADGEASTKTAIAIAQFQAENNLEVTGEVTPQLAGVVKAAGRGKLSSPAPAQPSAGAPGQLDLEARQQACVQEKIEAAQSRQKKKRGLGRLMSAAGRIATRAGTGGAVNQAAADVYNANATAEDLSAAAKDLGLTEDELEECRNPPVRAVQQ